MAETVRELRELRKEWRVLELIRERIADKEQAAAYPHSGLFGGSSPQGSHSDRVGDAAIEVAILWDQYNQRAAADLRTASACMDRINALQDPMQRCALRLRFLDPARPREDVCARALGLSGDSYYRIVREGCAALDEMDGGT